MASFTDAITQFNPYVQQLPLEAMAQVGMFKQAKYEENVQKIQGEIDKIAGLDVVRDVDKQYLQAKLNQLGSKLKTVAAGDFSNFQLVNSVGGMAKQIGKDPLVQNAVSSTAWYRKQAADMEKAISEGKAGQSNIWDFGEQVNSWMNSSDLKKSFRGRYTQYTDVKKKAMEAIKGLHPKLQQYDIPFKMNDDGTVDTRQIADAMKRYKIEGIDENQVEQAIRASLDQNDLNQLSIDGRYQFRGVGVDQLVKKATDDYDAQKKNALSTLDYLKEQRRIITDPNELEKVDAKIEYYNLLLGKDGVPGILDEKLKSNLETVRQNPDAVKTSLYKEGFVKEFANAFSWKNQVVTYETNPIRQQLNWVKTMEFNQQVENRRRYEFAQNLLREDEKIRLMAEKNALDKVALYGDPNASDWTPLGNPTDNELRSTELFTSHVSSVAGAIEGDMAKLKTKYSDALIADMLKDWEENTTKATKVKPDALKLIQNIAKNKNYLSALEEKEKRIRAEADREAGVDKTKAQILVGKKPLDITFRGVTFKLSPEEILGLEAATTRKETGSRAGTVVDVSVDRSKLNNNQLRFVNALEGIKYGRLKPSLVTPSEITQLDRSFGQVASTYNQAVNQYRDAINKSNELFRKKLAPIAQAFVPQIKAVATGKNGEPPPIIISRLSQLLTAADVKDIAADENFDLEKASTMLLEKNNKDTRVFIEQDGDNFRVHLKSESDPSNRQILKLSKGDVVRYFGEGYVNNKIQESIRINIGGGNTNITGDPKKAVFQKQFGDFPGVSRYQVTADLNQDLSDANLYTAMINVKRKDGGYQTFEISGSDNLHRVGYDQGRKSLNALTDQTLINLLKAQYPNYDYSNLDY